MPNERPTYTVLIASYLEPGHVERIRAVDERLRVVYTPELLPQPRYPADHVGKVEPRTPEQEAAWRALLAKADILFDFDYTTSVITKASRLYKTRVTRRLTYDGG